MKRKVLILPSWYPCGASMVSGIYVQNQVDVLSKEYDVAVLFPRLPSWRKLIRGKDWPKSQVEYRAGIKIYREETLLPPKLYRLRTYFYNRLARRGFEKVLKTWGKPHIIHAHAVLPGGWVGLNLGREYAIPVVLTEHSGPFSVHLQSKYQRRLVRETLSQVNRVIAVSPALAQQIKAFHNPIEVEVVGNVIKAEFFVPSKDLPKDPLHPRTQFLSIAILNKEKGLRYLIEAIHLLIQQGVTSFELFIGGDGPTRPLLEDMVRKLGLSNWCHFLGFLAQPEVKYWMQRCDVFVLPSLRETFGVVIGEAMACGKPVIATRCGGSEFIVENGTGFLVDVENSVALSEAMEAFTSQQVKFNSDSIRQSITQRFGEKAFLCNISSIYEQILTEH